VGQVLFPTQEATVLDNSSARKLVNSVATLKQSVSILSPTDLDELYRHITILRRLSGQTKAEKYSTPDTQIVAPTEVVQEERVLYDALAEGVARQLGARSAMPLKAFRQTPVYSQWCQAVARALEQHHTWFPKAQRPMTVSMLRLYADMVIGNLNNPDHPHGFGWRSVCWGLENLAMIVDKNFPDYARYGLLDLVATLRTSPNREQSNSNNDE